MIVFTLLASPAARERWGLPERSGWTLDAGHRAVLPKDEAVALLVDALGAPGGPCPGEDADALRGCLCLEPFTGIAVLRNGGEVGLRSPGESPEPWSAADDRVPDGWRGALLTVLSGPDAGLRVHLPRGRLTLGRAGEISVADPEMSRFHAVLEVDAGAVRCERSPGASPLSVLRDGGLAILPATRPWRRRGFRLQHGDVILLGQSRIRFSAGLPSAGLPGPEAAPSASQNTHEPVTPVIPAWRVALAILPVFVSGVAALYWGQPMLLLFGLLSLGAGLGLWAERRGALRRRRASEARRTAEDREFNEALFAPCPAERPRESSVSVLIEGMDDPQAMSRWGALNPVNARSAPAGRSPGGFSPGGKAAETGPPVAVRLGSVHPGTLGMGARSWKRGLRRRHEFAPEHRGVLFAPGDLSGRWTVRVDTRDPSGSLHAALLACRSLDAGREKSSPLVWVHEHDVDPAALSLPWVSVSAASALLHLCARGDCDGPGAGCIRFLCAPRRAAGDTNGGTWVADAVRRDLFFEECRRVRARLSARDALECAPSHDGVGVLEERWVFAPDAPGTEGIFDLDQDGPHAMVVGTTGSGKTELLKTLIVAAAVSSPPHALRLLLVDFKGGSGFAEFAGLPQVEQVVSNLDGAEVERVLQSLSADLERRERWLAEHSLNDFRAARLSRGDTAPPRLVVVIDELKALVDAVPAAAAQVANIAALGRSLGINLILASQRLQGAASSDLRANLGALFVLRVVSAQDSLDALGSAAAAEIPRQSPGTLYLRAGGEVRGPMQCVSWEESLHAGANLSPWPASPAEAETHSPGAAEGQSHEALLRLRSLAPHGEPGRGVWPPSIAPRMPDAPPRLAPGVSALVDDPQRQRRLLAEGPEKNLLIVGRSGTDREAALLRVLLGTIAARRGMAPDGGRCVLIVPEDWLPHNLLGTCDAWSPPDDLLSLVELMDATGRLSGQDCVVVSGLDVVIEGLRGLGSGSAAEVFQRWLGAGLHEGARVLASSSRLLGRLTDGFSAFAWMPSGVGESLRSAWPVRQSVPDRPGWALFTGRWMVRPELSGSPVRSGDHANGRPQECAHVGVFAAPLEIAGSARALDESSPLGPLRQGPFRPLPAAADRPEDVSALVSALPACTRPMGIDVGLSAQGGRARLALAPGHVTPILGAPGTGRTTILRNVADILSLPLAEGQSTDSRAEAQHPWGSPQGCVGVHLLDDADAAPPGALTAAEDHLRAGCALLAAVPVRPGMALRRWLDLWRAPSSGLVLSPADALDGDVLGLRVTAFPSRDPGCGWLVSPEGVIRFRAWRAQAPPPPDAAPRPVQTTGDSSARNRPSASRPRARRARSLPQEAPS